MKRLTLILLLVAAVVGLTLGLAAGARAHGDVDCYQNGREIRADQCAWLNMVAYAQQTYYLPSAQAFWVKQTRYGRWHSRWAFYGVFPAINLSYFTLSTRRCGGHMVVFDRRRKVYWPHPC